MITHSALTATLQREEGVRNSHIVRLDEFWPAGVMAANALERWPNSEEQNETGFSLANNTDKSMFEVFAAEPTRGARFAKFFDQPDPPQDSIAENFDWTNVQTMVDVGGSYGSIAISVAERFPHIHCVVQDLEATAQEGEARLPEHLRGRVEFRSQ